MQKEEKVTESNDADDNLDDGMGGMDMLDEDIDMSLPTKKKKKKKKVAIIDGDDMMMEGL